MSDTRVPREDKVLRAILNMNVPSESALGDWLRRISQAGGLKAINDINSTIIKNIVRFSGLKEGTLVIDPSIIFAEKREAKMTYEGYKGYRPHYAFLQESHIVVNCDFRDGNDTGRRLDLFEKTYNLLSSDLKIKNCLLDSEFYQADVITFLNEKKISWIISADQDSAVKELITCSTNWEPFFDRYGVQTDRQITETAHAMNKLEKPFRLIILRWPNGKNTNGFKYRCLATSIEHQSACDIVLQHDTRATQENVIKEVKGGFGMEHMPCGTLSANALYHSIGVLTYNLFIAQKLFTMAAWLKSKTIASIRWLLSAPVKVLRTANVLILGVCASTETLLCFQLMRKGNYEISRFFG